MQPPDAPSQLTVLATTTASIDLSWVDNSNDEEGFEVERGTDGTSFTRIATTAANTATYSDTTLAPATTYYYRVRAYAAGGASPYSSTVVAANECASSSQTCSGSTLTVCAANGKASNSQCALGCHPGGTRCYDLDPSNGLAADLDATSSAPPLELGCQGSAGTIDTTTGDVTSDGTTNVVVSSVSIPAPPGAPPMRVLEASAVTLCDVNVTGSSSLVIVANGDVVVAGKLVVAGRGSTSGPGAVLPGACSGGNSRAWDGGNTQPGAGGAGFGSAGAPGGAANSHAGGPAGSATGSVALVPLRAGCSGGGTFGEDSVTQYAAGGGGGGALQISSRTRITVDAATGGLVDAGGGGGATYCSGTCAGGGGGGSGGAVLLEAPVVVVSGGSGGLFANGGGGACPATPGQDGTTSAVPASGGHCTDALYSDGGKGGASSISPGAGVTILGQGRAGGGGGGPGRIRVNTADGTFSAASGAVTSPAATVGTVARR